MCLTSYLYLVINGGIQLGRLVPDQVEEMVADRVVDVDAGVRISPSQNPGGDRRLSHTLTHTLPHTHPATHTYIHTRHVTPRQICWIINCQVSECKIDIGCQHELRAEIHISCDGISS